MKKIITLCCFLLIASICFGHCMCCQDEETFWSKNLGSIITGLISFIAIIIASLFSYYTSQRTLDRQARMQLATTTNKEWVANVRECISKLIENFLQMKNARMKYKLEELGKSVEYQEAMKNFISTHIRISMYLDFNDELEYDLYWELIAKLWNWFTFIEENNESVQVIEDIQALAQTIFRNKQKVQ